MNKYGIDEATEAKLYDEAEEYSKTDEFELDKQDMQYKLQMEGKEIPDDEKLNEMVKEQYVDIRSSASAFSFCRIIAEISCGV